jgi:uncharacterized protein YndB with AHSA1/START domain
VSTTSRTIQASPERVWRVLADGWSYPLFVVGASRMRDVEPGWPAVGSRLHHSVGVWPALLDDDTESLEVEPGARLVLRARAWPAGEAHVEFRLTPVPDGTRVTLSEDAVSGPGRLVPKRLRDLQLTWRNTETLRRLAFVAEGTSDGETAG